MVELYIHSPIYLHEIVLKEQGSLAYRDEEGKQYKIICMHLSNNAVK
jgi:hypothetical protein